GAIDSNFFDIDGTSLTVAGCTFTNNLAVGGPVDNGVTFLSQGLGGAIENEIGPLVVTDSSFSGNRAVGGPGATVFPALYSFVSGGGAIENLRGTIATISNSTFDHNQSIGGAGGPAGAGSEG